VNLVQAVRIASDQQMDDPCWRLAWLMHYYYAWCGRWTEYVSVTTIGLRAAETSGNKAAVAALLNGMGAAHWKLGQPQAAVECYGRARTIRRELGDGQGEATVLSNLGIVEVESGNMTSAIGRFTEALAIHQGLGQRQGEAYSLHNLGHAHESANRSEEALWHYQQALAIRTAHGYLHDQAGSLHSIGALLLTMGQPEGMAAGIRHPQRGGSPRGRGRP
jgi:tetratricopeptide (TPR) repeat protein